MHEGEIKTELCGDVYVGFARVFIALFRGGRYFGAGYGDDGMWLRAPVLRSDNGMKRS